MRVLTITLITGLILWTGYQLNAAEDATAALEQAAETLESTEIPLQLDTGDTAWMMTATALVLFMSIPGLALFYGGLVRSKNILSVLVQCFAMVGIMSVIWVVYGYSLAFGNGGNIQWLIGDLSNAFLSKVSIDSISGTIPESVFVTFQMTFIIVHKKQ